MSAFNVGKKVSAAIRILQRNRDASARATHLVVKKYPLITYEKALLGQATGGKFPSVTFLERKTMSTKTSIKRIAAVAAVALTLGGFSAVSANAASLNNTTGIVGPYTDTFAPSISTVTATITAAISDATALAAGTTDTYTAANTFSVGDVVAITGMAATTFNHASVVVTSATATSFSVAFARVAGVVAAGTTGVATDAAHLTTSAGASSTASGYSITQTASTGGYVQLNPLTDVAGASSITATVTGGTILSGAGAASVCSAVGLPNQPLANKYAAGTFTGPYLLAATTGSGVTTADCVTAYGVGYTAGTLTNANLKIATPTAGTISVLISKTVTTNGVAAVTPIELIAITVLPSAAASAISYYTVTGANTAVGSGFTATSTKNTSFVSPATNTGSLTITTSAFTTGGVANANPLNTPALTYSVSGVGLMNGSSTAGTTYAAKTAASWTATDTVTLLSDGRSGTSTVTVAAAGVTIGTITVVFYGKVASVTTVAIYTIGKGSSSSNATGTLSDIDTSAGTNSIVPGANGFKSAGLLNDVAIAVVLKDANGSVVPDTSTLSATSSNPSAILSTIPTSFIDDGKGNGSVAFGYIHTTFATAANAVSGAKATLTYSYVNSDGTIISSTPVALTVGGVVAKEVISTDASSYAPGAPMIATITATDASGNPAYDGAASPALTFSKYVGGTYGASVYVGGKRSNKANTLFAPASAGDFSAFATGTDAAATPLSATVNVTDDAASGASSLALDAANAATDAANNAYDEAQNATQAASDALAAVTALSAQVSALIASVKSLAAVVAKIKAKVKA